MTRLLIISDSHGAIDMIQKVLKKETGQFDQCIHLGDRVEDMRQFQDMAEKFIFVKGNMDFKSENSVMEPPFERIVEIEGVKILITHGHRFKVHATTGLLQKEAEFREVKLVLYGHTHKKDFFSEKGISYFNPGSLKNKEYGKITIDKGSISEVSQLLL